jgi:hypothetical protein
VPEVLLSPSSDFRGKVPPLDRINHNLHNLDPRQAPELPEAEEALPHLAAVVASLGLETAMHEGVQHEVVDHENRPRRLQGSARSST